MNVCMALEKAQAEEARLAEVRRQAWNKDPGNTHMAHLTMTAWDYHEAFKRWNEARLRTTDLERQLREMAER